MQYDPKYVIYSLERCNFSQKAEKLLAYYNFPYTIIKVTQEDKQKYKDYLGKSTFPQIYYHDNYNRRYEIGGCSDLEELIKIRILSQQKYE